MKKNPILTTVLALLTCSAPALLAQNFDGISWTRWTDNTPRQDKSGSGSTPSTSGVTNNQSTYTFSISSSSTSSTQRQEWLYERQRDFTQMELRFRINPSATSFDKISIAQCHDDQTGSKGVFSIYQVRRSGSNFVFGVQGDTTEASNGYSQFSTRSVSLNTWYRLLIQTYTNGRNGSYEYARLYNNSGRLLWQNTIEGGGDSESYYKLGVYRLSGGRGPVSASFDDIKFWTGRRGGSTGGGSTGGGGSDRVSLRKRNASGFAMDGNRGARNGQNVYLWSYSSSNRNQKWDEISRGSGSFSYQKGGHWPFTRRWKRRARRSKRLSLGKQLAQSEPAVAKGESERQHLSSAEAELNPLFH